MITEYCRTAWGMYWNATTVSCKLLCRETRVLRGYRSETNNCHMWRSAEIVGQAGHKPCPETPKRQSCHCNTILFGPPPILKHMKTFEGLAGHLCLQVRLQNLCQRTLLDTRHNVFGKRMIFAPLRKQSLHRYSEMLWMGLSHLQLTSVYCRLRCCGVSECAQAWSPKIWCWRRRGRRWQLHRGCDSGGCWFKHCEFSKKILTGCSVFDQGKIVNGMFLPPLLERTPSLYMGNAVYRHCRK